MKKIFSLSFGLLFIVFLLGGNVSSANEFAVAKCAIPNFERAFENAEAIFVGKVLSEKTEDRMKIFELEVEKFWKGVEEKKITVNVYENPRYQAQFEVGERFLVFAEADEDGRLFDRRCSRTRRMNESENYIMKENLEKLGEPKTCISLSSKEKNN